MAAEESPKRSTPQVRGTQAQKLLDRTGTTQYIHLVLQTEDGQQVFLLPPRQAERLIVALQHALDEPGILPHSLN